MNKNSWLIGVGVAVVLLILAGLWAMSVNNSLVASQESMKAAWAQVETVLQRRYDLIPNLVATVKGYAEHEKEVLENVTRLRSQWGAAQTLEQKTKAANEMEGALARLLVVAERYPELKANQNFLELQSQLEGTENRIAVERRRYNEVAQQFNYAVLKFPANIVANMMGFRPKAYFKGAAGSNVAPEVTFQPFGNQPAPAPAPATATTGTR